MFDKMLNVLKLKMDNGMGGYEWNSDAESFYDAIWEMAFAGVISAEQWKKVYEFVRDYVKFMEPAPKVTRAERK